MKIPQLAIHLNREVNTKGLLLNKQIHMQPIWGLGQMGEPGFRDWLGAEIDLDPDSIMTWDAMTHDIQPSAVIGVRNEFISAPRMDNLASSFSCVRALIEAVESGKELNYVPVVALFDHEEVGSEWVMRTDLECGSTIGPITAQNLGMDCVDVGNPMLGMHSIRETGGASDPDYMRRALAHLLV
ncbi:UNVERIFIED_CONTAM: hypothetical protein GTU68_012380 [Idotea baltica]|nr:hypothetical protein [Idotea baltica]